MCEVPPPPNDKQFCIGKRRYGFSAPVRGRWPVLLYGCEYVPFLNENDALAIFSSKVNILSFYENSFNVLLFINYCICSVNSSLQSQSQMSTDLL